MRRRNSVTTDLTVLLRAISYLPVRSGNKWSSDGAARAENEFPDAALILSLLGEFISANVLLSFFSFSKTK